MSALAGCGGAWILNSETLAAPVLTVMSQNTTHTFLTANNLQSAVIGATGFAAGENLQGFRGVPGNPWVITCSSGAFFNLDGVTSFYGDLQTAFPPVSLPGFEAYQFDSGTTQSATNAFGGISGPSGSNPIGFAQFGVGQNSGPGTNVYWLSLDPNGIPVPTTQSVFRLTWSRSASVTVSMLLVTNTGGGNGFEYPVSLTIPAIPAPGSLALLGIALLNGRRCRRQ